MDGEYKEYYPSGKLKIITNYINGAKQGEYKEYHDSQDDCIGKLKIICNYINGRRTGEYTEYYQNGELKDVYDLLQ